MKVFVVANPKGGSGKSTFSTNLAGALAKQEQAEGGKVMLGDIDRQQSSREWLQLRPPYLPPIATWEVPKDGPARPPKGTAQVVLDTPAGLHGKALERVLKAATHIIVPVQPSLFDILATRSFLEALQEEKAVRKGNIQIGIIGMRVDPRTRAASDLENFLRDYQLPVLTWLRDTQLYVQTTARGMTLFDLPPSRIERDLQEWQPVLDWAAA
jgi:chromosome partitioning protein